MSFLSDAASYLTALKSDGRTGVNFEYSPLKGTTTVRLLKIHPGSPADLISCSLRDVNLDDQPEYTALSYCWRKQRNVFEAGAAIAKETLVESIKQAKFTINLPDSKPPVELTKLIQCNGKDFFISPALDEILKSFRDKGTSREYWIDGICIDQSNDVEKTVQVKLMGRIYSTASLVLVWLGSFSFKPHIMPSLEKMAKLPDASLPPVSIPGSKYKYYRALGHDLGIKFDGTPFEQEVYLAAEITQCLWFKRIWVLQELFLARKAIFLYAGHQLSFEAMRKILIWVYANPTERDWGRASTRSALMPLISTIVAPHTIDFVSFLNGCELVSKGKRLNIIDWVRACRGRQAGDPRDMVFGGLSLIHPDHLSIDRLGLQLQEYSDVNGHLPQLPPRPERRNSPSAVDIARPEVETLLPRGLWARLESDYQATDPEVFINFAACLLSQQDKDSISILLSLSSRRLRHVSNPGQGRGYIHDAGIPSWAPALGAYPSLGTKSDLLSAPVEASGGGSTFAAATLGQSRTDHPRPQISVDGRTLRLSAIAIDVVTRDLGKECPGAFIGLKLGSVRTFFELLLSLPHTYPANGRFSLDAIVAAYTACLPSTMDEAKRSDSQKEHSGTPGEATSSGELRPGLDLLKELDRSARYTAAELCHNISEIEGSNDKGKEDELMTMREELRKLESVYLQLSERHPNFQWAGITDVIRQQSGPAAKSFEQWESAVSSEAASFIKAILPVYAFSTLFFTKNGLIGVGPGWLRPDDQVMLVQGARVPYLFRHIKNAELNQSIEEAQRELIKAEARLAKCQKKDKGAANMRKTNGKPSALTWKQHKTVKNLRLIIEESRLRIGRDSWELIGEVYIEGIMHGEAIEQVGSDAFEKISIV